MNDVLRKLAGRAAERLNLLGYAFESKPCDCQDGARCADQGVVWISETNPDGYPRQRVGPYTDERLIDIALGKVGNDFMIREQESPRHRSYFQ